MLPIIDEEGLLVGEVHQSDVLKLKKANASTVDSVVRSEVHSVTGDTTLDNILPLLTRTNSPIWVVDSFIRQADKLLNDCDGKY